MQRVSAKDSARLTRIALPAFVASLLLAPAAIAQSDGASYRLVDDPSVVEAQRVNFNQSLKRLGLPEAIHACKLVIQLLPASGDPSYGAICSLDGPKPSDVLVCDDSMVGKFTLKAWGFGESAKNAAQFTQENCPSGG